MAIFTIPSGQLEATTITLTDTADTLIVEGQIIAQPAVITQRDLNHILVQPWGLLESNNATVQIEGRNTSVVNHGVIDGAVIDVVNGGQASATILNTGTIITRQRAINMGGASTAVINSGTIILRDDPSNGVIYADATAKHVSVDNQLGGVIDVGQGNDGDAISLELGETVDGSITNQGEIYGRGGANLTHAAAIRLYKGDGIDGTATFNGAIANSGLLSAEINAAILIEDNVFFSGTITNNGVIEGGVYKSNGAKLAIDGRQAEDSLTIINNGTINGDVLLTSGDDVYRSRTGNINGIVVGGNGNDLLIGCTRGEVLKGGRGDDRIKAGSGDDRVFGQQGDDVIHAGDGDDLIVGGRGNNTVFGGDGADIFRLNKGRGVTVIKDFSLDDGDVLDVRKGAIKQIEFTQVGRDTVVSLGRDELAVLSNVNADSLPASVLV
ncbi:MAG: calcium-binding protein [Cyanobacteria bacterium P01_E01_bin.6]